jgi:galactokinase
MEIKAVITELFNEKFGHRPAYIARAPGRVNLLGEHVDYNDGFVLPAATDRATYIAFSQADSDQNNVFAADFGEQVAFSSENLDSRSQSVGTASTDWARYPAGVAWALLEDHLAVKGMDAVFSSNIPRGAGLSSSASVELVFATAWMMLGGWKATPMELAVRSRRAENKYVGVNCGIMDQFASACGQKDRLLLLDCRSLEYKTLPLPDNVVIIIADTSVRHSHTTSAYNDRRAACEEAVRILKMDLPDIKALRDVSMAELDRLSTKLPAEVEKRARHVVEEIDRTHRAVTFLRKGDIEGFGQLMNACHVSLRDLYEVSCQELDAMAKIAQLLEGCYGARLTGGGFGGCTVNLVAHDKADTFTKSLAAKYKAETGLHPEIYTCRASQGAGLV